MDFYIDGKIFTMQSHGGISRIFKEILPRICEIDNSVKVSFLLFGEYQTEPPIHPNIVIQKCYGRNRYWGISTDNLAFKMGRRLITRMRIGNTRRKIWHSTYFTYLPKWDGPYVVSVHDMIYEKFPFMFPDSETIIR